MQQYTRLPSQTSANSFVLPENRYLQEEEAPQQPQEQGLNSPLPPRQDNLAEIEGTTDKYYDMWGKLNAFAHGMQKDFGIDVTAPDFTQPGGGLPFKTYQKLSAAVMHTANKLGNRMKEQVQMRPYQATGQVTGTGEENDPYVSTNLSPEVEDMQKTAHEDFYTKQDAQRAQQQQLEPRLAELADKAKSGDPYWVHQYETAKALRTTNKIHPSLFIDRGNGEDKSAAKAQAKATSELGVLKKLTSDKNGAWLPGSYHLGKFPGTEEDAAYNPQLKGNVWGDYVNENNKKSSMIIDGLWRKPDGTTWMTFKQTADGVDLPPERVDDMPADQFAAQIMQKNQTFGKANNMYAALRKLDMADIGGNLDEAKFYAEDHPGVKARTKEVDKMTQHTAGENKARAHIDSELDRINTYFKDETFQANGWTFHNKGKKYYIGDNNDILYTKDQVKKLLEDAGYFRKEAGMEDESAEPVNTPREEEATETPEIKKVRELIKKHS